MVELCGAVGDTRNFTALVDDLHRNGNERAFAAEDGSAAVASVVHPSEADFGYAEAADGARIWLWGTVWGFDSPDGYEPVPEAGAKPGSRPVWRLAGRREGTRRSHPARCAERDREDSGGPKGGIETSVNGCFPPAAPYFSPSSTSQK